MTEIKPIVFKVGNEEYGVDIGIVRGIEKVLPVTPIHKANKNVKGIINLRGEVIPLYSLRRKFDMPDAQYTDNTKFIVIKTKELQLALEVDSVGEIQAVPDNSVFEMPKILKTEDTKHYDKIIDVNNRIVVMLNVNKLLTKEETTELKDALEELE